MNPNICRSLFHRIEILCQSFFKTKYRAIDFSKKNLQYQTNLSVAALFSSKNSKMNEKSLGPLSIWVVFSQVGLILIVICKQNQSTSLQWLNTTWQAMTIIIFVQKLERAIQTKSSLWFPPHFKSTFLSCFQFGSKLLWTKRKWRKTFLKICDSSIHSISLIRPWRNYLIFCPKQNWHTSGDNSVCKKAASQIKLLKRRSV